MGEKVFWLVSSLEQGHMNTCDVWIGLYMCISVAFSLTLCLTHRDGRASWRPTYLEDSSWACAQSPVSDGQQVTVEEEEEEEEKEEEEEEEEEDEDEDEDEEEEKSPTIQDTQLFLIPQRDRVFPGLHLSRAGPGSPGLLQAQMKAWEWCRSSAEAAWLWSSASICLHLPSHGMPMVSVQTCGFVCMLVSLITLWTHSWVSPVVQSLCACMKPVTHTLIHTHTHTHTHRNTISSISTLECHPFPDSEAEHKGCLSGRLKRCQCMTDVFLHAVSAEDIRVCECRIYIQHWQRSRRLSHEDVFISDQMDCANYLFMSVFYNKHVCLYPLPPFFLFVQEYIVTQMLPLSVTAQGTLLHFLWWCPPQCLWRPHQSGWGRRRHKRPNCWETEEERANCSQLSWAC